MYRIIGADQQEYGPVSADQIRQWIREGRANGATLAKAEGSADFAPLSTFAEFADALAAAQPAIAAPPLEVARPASTGEYDLDIGRCVGRSWALFTQNAGLLIGATVVFLLVILVVNQAIGFLTRGTLESVMAGEMSVRAGFILFLSTIPEVAISAVLTGGFYMLLLRLIRGQPAGIGVLFAGFGTHFASLVGAGILVQLLTMLGLAACVLPGIYLSVSWIYTSALILDRGLGAWTAMELSRRAVTRRWWLVFCLILVVALIGVVGLLACCVGLLVALPVGMGALAYGYEEVFGRTSSTQTGPI